MTPILLLRAAGVLLLLIAASSLFTPRILAYADNMKRLDPTVREVFNIHNLYVTLFVLAFAVAALAFPRELSGTPMGRFFSGFLAGAWWLRLLIQIFYHNREIKKAWPVMNLVYSLTFIYLGGVFAMAASGYGR
ncbi:hypothetical protein TA3x_000270 [Tundrisphaera sp. TA3]|uniref:hypothetical protein n=1 Tax=Tundrisphaera sp. TA3 TaxID=3435775 RepID=UPI003EC04F89